MNGFKNKKPIDISIELNDNFGHNGIVYHSDVSIERDDAGEELCSGSSIVKYLKDENGVKLKGMSLHEKKDLFKICRYTTDEIKVNIPNMTTGPTLCMALFMPNRLQISKMGEWAKRYLANQLKLCFVFNYYFPNGNYRTYFDQYMIDKLAKVSGDDSILKFTNYVKKDDFIYYHDYGTKDRKVENMLMEIYDMLKVVDNTKKFKNGASRIIYYFLIVSKCYEGPNNRIIKKDKHADLFGYKLENPFLENIGTELEGHKTNGFIGQLMRYLSLRQKDYIYKNNKISAPIHFIWRDAHASMIGLLDSEWIKELNTYANKGECVYFLPISLGNYPTWHGRIINKINNSDEKSLVKSISAGITQICNSTIKDDDVLYLKTIGLPFIITKNNILPLEIIRHTGSHRKENFNGNGNINRYDYGIDEYILTQFLINEKVLANSVYLNYKANTEFLKERNYRNYIYSKITKISIFMLLEYLINIKILSRDIKLRNIDIFNKIEDIRSNNIKISNASDKILIGFLLSLIPNKYQIQIFLFPQPSYMNKSPKIISPEKINLRRMCDSPKNIDELYKIYNLNEDDIKYFKKLSIESLQHFHIDCKATIVINTVGEPQQDIYNSALIKKVSDTMKTGCHSYDYLSGFYDVDPPSLDIGILRQPKDFKYAIKAMKENKLFLPLNKSNYKLESEREDFTNITKKCRKNNSTVIKKEYLTDIKKIKNNFASKIFQNLNDEVASALIWKALNFYGYDVSPDFFDSIKFDKDQDYKKFNENVKILANEPNWADSTFNIIKDTNGKTSKLDNEKFKMKQIVKGGLDEYPNEYPNEEYDTSTLLVVSSSLIFSNITKHILLAVSILIIIYLIIRIIKQNQLPYSIIKNQLPYSVIPCIQTTGYYYID